MLMNLHKLKFDTRLQIITMRGMKNKLKIFLLLLIFNSSVYGQMQLANDFTTIDIRNDTFQLFQLLNSGYYVLMDCGTLWCAWCRLSEPALKSYWNKYHSNKGCFYILSFDIDERESTSKLAEHVTHESIPYPVFAMDSNQNSLWYKTCWQYFGENSIPQFVLIKPDKTIPYKHIGGLIGRDATYLDSVINNFMESAVCYNLEIDSRTAFIDNIIITPIIFDNILNLEIDVKTQSDIRYYIFDNTGKVLMIREKRQLIGEYKEQINTEFYKSGIYFLEIVINSKVQTKKIIKI